MPKVLCIGLGMVGKALTQYDAFTGVSHKDFKPLMLRGYDACVNTAAITGYSLCKRTDRHEVISANVNFALYLKAACVATNTILFQPSTTGMYMPQTCPKIDGFIMPKEDSETKAYNLYVESKLEMEQYLQDCYIFRMPLFFEPDATKRPAWSYVQDTYLSILYPHDLMCHILNFIRIQPEYGIYNVDSKVVYLPELFKEGNPEVRKSYAKDMTSALPIDCSKLDSMYKETYHESMLY